MPGGTMHEYLGKMTLYAFFACIIAAATVGFIFGHGVNFKMEEDTNTNKYIKLHIEGLTMFINNYFLPALVAMVAHFFAYLLTTIFGKKISPRWSDFIFRAINGAFRSANRAGHQSKGSTSTTSESRVERRTINDDNSIVAHTKVDNTRVHKRTTRASEIYYHPTYHYYDSLWQEVTLLCYWNEKITNGSNGISRELARSTAIMVKNKITYDELYEKIYNATMLNRNQFKPQIKPQITIKCKFPMHLEHKLVCVDNDDSVAAVLEVAKENRRVELYLEIWPSEAVKEGEEEEEEEEEEGEGEGEGEEGEEEEEEKGEEEEGGGEKRVEEE